MFQSLPELHKELTESGQNLALADQESNPDSVTKIDDQGKINLLS